MKNELSQAISEIASKNPELTQKITELTTQLVGLMGAEQTLQDIISWITELCECFEDSGLVAGGAALLILIGVLIYQFKNAKRGI